MKKALQNKLNRALPVELEKKIKKSKSLFWWMIPVPLAVASVFIFLSFQNNYLPESQAELVEEKIVTEFFKDLDEMDKAVDEEFVAYL